MKNTRFLAATLVCMSFATTAFASIFSIDNMRSVEYIVKNKQTLSIEKCERLAVRALDQNTITIGNTVNDDGIVIMGLCHSILAEKSDVTRAQKALWKVFSRGEEVMKTKTYRFQNYYDALMLAAAVHQPQKHENCVAYLKLNTPDRFGWNQFNCSEDGRIYQCAKSPRAGEGLSDFDCDVYQGDFSKSAEIEQTKQAEQANSIYVKLGL